MFSQRTLVRNTNTPGTGRHEPGYETENKAENKGDRR